ncbi:MAG: 3-deoxy-8-phosphooctulonate synthase [Candidatus Aminicenantes bacterium]|nr:3-deoxy-8-phosphooctulonate synthase [Candidatus Aminicenantes bacterium]
MTTVAKEIKLINNVKIGGPNSFFLIGGPCVIETHKHTFFLAREIKKICDHLKIPFIFKASYDKANRSSISSFRGPGLEKGLDILNHIKKELGVPILSDVHETAQVEKAAEVLDVIQIPAFLCRQTDLILAAAQTQKPLNIKKGQFLSPYDMKNVIDKILSQKNDNIIITERGTFFGYNNLVFDIRSIPIMKRLGFPVVIDASHSVQKPGGQGASSGGDAEFIPYIAKAGVSVGADGVFLEIHDNPPQALSDKHNSLYLNELHVLLSSLCQLKSALSRNNSLD